jgi:hypothetical protein
MERLGHLPVGFSLRGEQPHMGALKRPSTSIAFVEERE